MRCSTRMIHWAKQYLAYRRNLGFRLNDAGQLLERFAQYADQTGHRGPVTIELAVRWARLPRDASPVYWARRLDIVRSFAKYRAIFDPATEIPPRGTLGPAYRRITPHIYSDTELAALLVAASRLPPLNGLRPHTYVTLFGLLASTGLRLSEALQLNRSDFDAERGVLTIRLTKFRKSRLVPLHSSTCEALHRYARQRDNRHRFLTTDAFFITCRVTRLCRATAQGTFGNLRDQLGWASRNGGRPPRIHDLRHTFACRRLLLWYQQGVDVDHAIAALSTYLGHASVSNTYWYLTGVPELLELATVRFERFAAPTAGDQS